MRLALHTRGWRGLLARVAASPEAEESVDVTSHACTDPAAGAKRILVIDVTTPRPDRDSGSVRAVNLMRALRSLGHAVHFLPDDRRHAGRYTSQLHAHGIHVHAGAGGYPGWLAREGRRFDAVVVCRYHLGEFLIPLLRKRLPHALVVLDTVDLHHLRESREAEVRRDAGLARLAERTRRRELAAIAGADATWVVSPAEQALLRQALPDARVLVMPNIVEPVGDANGFAERSGLLFLGGALHPPNVDAVRWLAQEIFPLVRNRLPTCDLHVVGSGFPQALGDLTITEGLRLHGHVPDIAQVLDDCRVGLAPLRFGAGVKGKINSCMAAGMPVVATTCAVEGMHLTEGEDVLVADTPAAFADAIVRLHSSEDLWSRLSIGGMQNVEMHFSPDTARRAIAATLEERH